MRCVNRHNMCIETMRKMRKTRILVVQLLLLHLTASSAQLELVQRPICPSIGYTTQSTRLQSWDPVKSFTEISGLALSPTQDAPSGDPVLFGVSDGGGGERLGMFDSSTGQRLLTLELPSGIFTNKDWESMAIGSCGSTGINETCLYIGDIGDNTARTNSGRRTSRGSSTPYRILKIREPLLKDFTASNNVIPMSDLSILTFNYRDASSPTDYSDCESMFLDHQGWGQGGSIGDLYLVTKWGQNNRKQNNRLFKIPASAWPVVMDGSMTVSYSPQAVATYIDTNGGLMQHTWTEADATFDGTLIALGTIEGNYIFLRCPGATVAEALTGAAQPCLRWDPPSPGQVETISWTLDGTRSINIPEGNNRPLGWTSLVYDPMTTTKTCPQLEWVETVVRDGQRVRYCRSRDDGTSRPPAWCEGVDAVVFASSSGRGDVNIETAAEDRVDPIEVTFADVAEERDETTQSNGETSPSTRHLRFIPSS